MLTAHQPFIVRKQPHHTASLLHGDYTPPPIIIVLRSINIDHINSGWIRIHMPRITIMILLIYADDGAAEAMSPLYRIFSSYADYASHVGFLLHFINIIHFHYAFFFFIISFSFSRRYFAFHFLLSLISEIFLFLFFLFFLFTLLLFDYRFLFR